MIDHFRESHIHVEEKFESIDDRHRRLSGDENEYRIVFMFSNIALLHKKNK